VGPNASGKTNFLESIRVLSLSKSFRTKSDAELIKFNEDFARVEGKTIDKNQKSKFEVIVNRVGTTLQKSIKINGKVSRALDLIGKLTTVLFTPEDLNLAFSSPGIRRRYLDVSICQVDPIYCRDLSEYKRVIYNRNQLLFAIREKKANSSELYFWNERLIELGHRIIGARLDIIKFYNKLLTSIYDKINNNHQALLIAYKSNIPNLTEKDLIKEMLRKEIDLKRDWEIKKARSMVGPHRDDFILRLDKRDLSLFGSRGEVRSAVLALKFAELDFFEFKLGDRPVLLLDDIFSELDEERKSQLINILDKQQTIVTTTDLEFIKKAAAGEGEILKVG
jgi:DNA replication and repair protein RecF